VNGNDFPHLICQETGYTKKWTGTLKMVKPFISVDMEPLRNAFLLVCRLIFHQKTTLPVRLFATSLMIGLLATGLVHARDFVTITASKTAVIDRSKGTAVWQKNVHVIRRSTGSTLMTDQLSIERDTTSDQLVWAEANGSVHAVYYQGQVSEEKLDQVSEEKGNPPDRLNLPQEPHSVVTCDLATFSRKTALAELQGRVHILSKDFELQAEKIRYDYRAERGKITARPGEQVQFVFYKKPTTNGMQPTARAPVRQKVSGVATEILANRPSRKMVLQGKVYIIDYSDQSQFRADRAELFFNEQEEIEIIIANGNFSMNQPGRVSRSDRAVFEYAKEEVTLIGNAYVKEDNKVEVTSARIKMYIKVNQGIIRGVDDIPVKMEIEID